MILALGGCASVSLSAGSSPPADDQVLAVDVTGMEPQIAIIRRDAADRGWRITCQGRAGEEQVVRLTFPSSTHQQDLDSYFSPQDHIGSSFRFYSPSRLPPDRCDQEAPTTSTSGPPNRVMAAGPLDLMTQLAETARRCGYFNAAVREHRADDSSLPPELPSEWRILDAGEDVGHRYGPAICFVQMRSRVLPPRQ